MNKLVDIWFLDVYLIRYVLNQSKGDRRVVYRTDLHTCLEHGLTVNIRQFIYTKVYKYDIKCCRDGLVKRFRKNNGEFSGQKQYSINVGELDKGQRQTQPFSFIVFLPHS